LSNKNHLKPRKPRYIGKDAIKYYVKKRIGELNSEFSQTCALAGIKISFDEAQFKSAIYPTDAFFADAFSYVRGKYAFLHSTASQLINNNPVSFRDFAWRSLQSQGYYCILAAARGYFVKRKGEDYCTSTEGHGEIQDQINSLSDVGEFFKTARTMRLFSDYTITMPDIDLTNFNPHYIMHIHEMFGLLKSSNKSLAFFKKMGISI
jgi:hypothetical protein